MVVNKFLKENIDVIKQLSKVGVVPCNVISDLDIYKRFEATNHIKSRMSRYTIVSSEMGVSEAKVRKLVRFMEKEMR